MTNSALTISVDDFRNVLSQTLEEAFTNVHGYFLDKGDSLFETLAEISAEQASRSLGPRSGNIAAKVNHIRFYLDAVIANAQAGELIPVDWESSWAVGEVDDAAWQDLIARLEATVTAFRGMAESNEVWPAEIIAGAMGVVAHTAYHLGEIRQALAALAAEETASD